MDARALITGASSGIGLELARAFARHGHDVVLVARRADRLEALAAELRAAGRRADTVALDLASPDAAVALANEMAARQIDVDVLVNNAGQADLAAFRDLDRARLQQMLTLNVLAVTDLVRVFLPGMLAWRRGRILNIASVAAFQPAPSMAAYAASKAYVLSLTEALAEELRGTGVTVTAVCPGLTRTDMTAGSPLPEFLSQSAAEVAEAAYAACVAGDVVHVPGTHNAAAAVATRLQPRWLVRALGGIVGRVAMAHGHKR